MLIKRQLLQLLQHSPVKKVSNQHKSTFYINTCKETLPQAQINEKIHVKRMMEDHNKNNFPYIFNGFQQKQDENLSQPYHLPNFQQELIKTYPLFLDAIKQKDRNKISKYCYPYLTEDLLKPRVLNLQVLNKTSEKQIEVKKIYIGIDKTWQRTQTNHDNLYHFLNKKLTISIPKSLDINKYLLYDEPISIILSYELILKSKTRLQHRGNTKVQKQQVHHIDMQGITEKIFKFPSLKTIIKTFSQPHTLFQDYFKNEEIKWKIGNVDKFYPPRY